MTDKAHALARAIAEVLPETFHDTSRYANNRVEADHGRLKARLRPMRGSRTDRSAAVVIRDHTFVQNRRRGHYTFDAHARHPHLRVAAAFAAEPEPHAAREAGRATATRRARAGVRMLH